MKSSGFGRYALGVSVLVAVVTGCRGPPPAAAQCLWSTPLLTHFRIIERFITLANRSRSKYRPA